VTEGARKAATTSTAPMSCWRVNWNMTSLWNCPMRNL
jgi:hypothetical protein